MQERFASLENKQDPTEHYYAQMPATAGILKFAAVVKEHADVELERIAQNITQHAEISGSSMVCSGGCVSTGTSGWACTLGWFFSAERDMEDFLSAARSICESSIGKVIYLRDSYSFTNDVWTAKLTSIALDSIKGYPPDPSSRDVFEIVRDKTRDTHWTV